MLQLRKHALLLKQKERFERENTYLNRPKERARVEFFFVKPINDLKLREKKKKKKKEERKKERKTSQTTGRF
jgi:hypothetical protein